MMCYDFQYQTFLGIKQGGVPLESPESKKGKIHAPMWSIYKKYLNHPLGLTLSTPSLVNINFTLPSSGLGLVSILWHEAPSDRGQDWHFSGYSHCPHQAGHGIVGRQLSVIVTRESVGKHLWYPRQPAASPDSFHHINQPQLGLPSVPALMPGLSPCRPL